MHRYATGAPQNGRVFTSLGPHATSRDRRPVGSAGGPVEKTVSGDGGDGPKTWLDHTVFDQE